VVLVRDDPSTPLLVQPEREPEAVRWVIRELLRGSATQKGVGVGDLVAGRDVQGHDLKRGAPRLPIEERRPRLAVGVDAADAVVRRRNVEHLDVIRVVREDAIHVAGVHRLGPPLDQRPDLFLVFVHR
jgi:hypothetical protein